MLLDDMQDDGSTSNIDDLMNSGLLAPTQNGQPVPLQTAQTLGPAPSADSSGYRAPAAATLSPGAAPRKPMVDRIHDWLMDKLGGNDIPAGYQGLLDQSGVSPEEIQKSKPGLGTVIGRTLAGVGEEGDMRARMEHLIQLKQATAGIAEQQRLRGVHHSMAQMFPPTPGESEAQLHDRMQQMYAYLVQNGDLEGAKELGQTARAIMAMPKTPTLNPEWETVHNVKGDPAGAFAGQTVTRIIDKRTGKVIQELPEAPAPKSGDATAATTRENNSMRERIANDFETNTKPFAQALSNYNVVKAATDKPSKTSMMSALTGYAHLISPTVRGVGPILNILKDNIGSFSDKFQRYINKGMTGQWEPGFLNEIQSAADDIMQSHARDYEVTRQAHLTRAKAAGILDDNMQSILVPAPTFGAPAAGILPGPARKTVGDLRKKLGNQ